MTAKLPEPKIKIFFSHFGKGLNWYAPQPILRDTLFWYEGQ